MKAKATRGLETSALTLEHGPPTVSETWVSLTNQGKVALRVSWERRLPVKGPHLCRKNLICVLHVLGRPVLTAVSRRGVTWLSIIVPPCSFRNLIMRAELWR